MQKGGYVYILCSNNRNALYTGVSSALRKRIYEHKNKHYTNSYTAKYQCAVLVYYCYFDSIEAAIAEEKRLKGGSRQQKLNLINAMNPEWRDLWEDIRDWD